MNQVAVLLRLLAEKSYTATVENERGMQVPIRDATDFRLWLQHCAELAYESDTIGELASLISSETC